MRILITGGCGFIGSNLAVGLAGKGCKVTAFDNLSRRGSETLLQRLLAHDCTFQHGDIRNQEDLARLTSDYDLMIECSAEPSVLVGTRGDDARFMINNNLIGSINCFEYARQRRLPVIFISTSRVYPYDSINLCALEEQATRFELAGNPAHLSSKGVPVDYPLKGVRSLYGATKLASELLLQEYSAQYELPAIINRCGVIAGPWQLGKVDQGVFTYWLASHYFKKPLKYIGFGGQGKQVRDLLHVHDLVELITRQADRVNDFRGQVFNVGGGRVSNLSLQETSTFCQKITGNRVEIGSVFDNRPADMAWYITDNGNTEDTFHWHPTRNPEQILTDTYHWLKEHENKFRALFSTTT
jgi:CDP-paratose 2-epimerase